MLEADMHINVQLFIVWVQGLRTSYLREMMLNIYLLDGLSMILINECDCVIMKTSFLMFVKSCNSFGYNREYI
jgi:hypothetical protein